jgi:hypothetical protein
MRVLIACEFSGVVRDAFRRNGHEAWSCDLESMEPEGEWPNYHLYGDARDFLSKGWDLLIAHPPCTYLCNSGVRWLSNGKTLNKERHDAMKEACDLFAAFYHADIPRVCVENPIMHRYARDYLQSAWKVPTFTQSIQPWQFGHGEVKRTCLWFRHLSPLTATQIVSGREARVHRASPGANRWKERSRTLRGIAQAMASQWGI